MTFRLSRPLQHAEPASPCVNVCKLDAASVCVGCGRSLDEIGEWSAARVARKQEILRLAAVRRRQHMKQEAQQ